jgi:hypothetical protein
MPIQFTAVFINKGSTCVDMHLAVYTELQHINSSSWSILILIFLLEYNEIQEQEQMKAKHLVHS